MMSTSALVVLVLSLCSEALGTVPFIAKQCSKKTYLKLHRFHMETYPIRIPGTVKASVKFEILKKPEAGKKYQLQTELIRDTFLLGDTRVPACVSNLGTCTFDFCQFLNSTSRKLSRNGECSDKFPCSCEEVKPQIYNIPDFDIEITKEMLPSTSLLYTDYKLELKIVDEKTQEVFDCLHFQFDIQKPKTKEDECSGFFCFG